MEEKYSEILKPLKKIIMNKWIKKNKTHTHTEKKRKKNVLNLRVSYFWKVTAQGSLSHLVCAKHFFFFLFFDCWIQFSFQELPNNNHVISFNVLFQKSCVSHKEEISMLENFPSTIREVTFQPIWKLNYKYLADIRQGL